MTAAISDQSTGVAMIEEDPGMVTLTVVSTFSGVGGIDLAFERAGCRTVLLCEIDKHARKVLAHRFPDVPIHPDIKELTADDLHAAGARPESTVLVAGFPCQDLSVAGPRCGLGHGTRSGLYWHLDRLMAEFRPAWVVFENVPGLLSAGCPEPCPGGCVATHGGAMGAVLGSLAERGYGFAYRVLDAQYFGVPQRRERVVIVGRLGDSGAAPAQVLLEPESGTRHPRPRFATWPGAARWATSRVGGAVVSTLTAHHARSSIVPMTYQKALTAAGIVNNTTVRRLTPLECERLQGHPDGWTAVDGMSDSQRYKQMGNGVAVPVFEWVARRLVKADAALREAVA